MAKYGFGKAREYFLLLDGKRYDSKAIAGVAYGYEHPKEGSLSASAFSGGEDTVRRVLQDLGFTVVKGAPGYEEPGALVLVENEETVGGEYDFWADDTGACYHFPNQYQNRVRTGLPFVYYRGVRRAGGKRGAAEYFGAGVIGEVWADPEQPADTPARNRRWYCAIEEYGAFPVPLSAKHGGKSFENVMTAMGWRTGVREITSEIFSQIVEAARATRGGPQVKRVNVPDCDVLGLGVRPLQVLQEPVERRLIGVVVFPLGEITDVPVTTDGRRPCYIGVRDCIIQAHWKQH